MKRFRLKFFPTHRLRAILDEPYNRGADGKDYGPIKEEIESLLWARESEADQGHWGSCSDELPPPIPFETMEQYAQAVNF